MFGEVLNFTNYVTPGPIAMNVKFTIVMIQV